MLFASCPTHELLGPFADQLAAVVSKVPEKGLPFHRLILTSSNSPATAATAATRFIAIASDNAE